MGPLLVVFDPERGGSDQARACGRKGRSEAEEKQEHGGKTVEEPFEIRERHDTHTLKFETLREVRAFLI